MRRFVVLLVLVALSACHNNTTNSAAGRSFSLTGSVVTSRGDSPEASMSDVAGLLRVQLVGRVQGVDGCGADLATVFYTTKTRFDPPTTDPQTFAGKDLTVTGMASEGCKLVADSISLQTSGSSSAALP